MVGGQDGRAPEMDLCPRPHGQPWKTEDDLKLFSQLIALDFFGHNTQIFAKFPERVLVRFGHFASFLGLDLPTPAISASHVIGPRPSLRFPFARKLDRQGQRQSQ